MQGVLYIGHGSRVQEGNRQFENFVKDTMSMIDIPVQETCFLELADPGISEGVRRCKEKGVTKLLVIPVLLLTAGHAKQDIPEELRKALVPYPELEVSYGRPFGIEEKIFNVLEERLRREGWKPGDEADVLLVGRGSSDPEAIEDFHTICHKFKEFAGLSRVEASFLAAASPSFPEGLEVMKKTKAKTVYVLPYLLFTGVLIQEMEEAISSLETNVPFRLCSFLGYDHELADILKERVLECKKAQEGKLESHAVIASFT
ncbi:sirohydrochlorin chelatase [Thalassobacillus sp. C254]|uniref:sirohydrochlorin chelatase n=1 Tax=Thalassobacillus sp. C254 TaxID=1225341 RepID=UPI0006D01B20|nr:sirohydrochlorin chelatase [Thalassobacillus sp. C254]